MKKAFNELPNSSKVWIYQSKDQLSEQLKADIIAIGTDFLNSWESHGSSIPSSIDIFHDQFVLISADDCGDGLCGRAKDAQVRLMQQLEIQLNVILTDRMLTAYKENNNIVSVNFNDFKKLANNNVINSETIVYNNLIETKEDFITNWETQAKNSWHKQFLN